MHGSPQQYGRHFLSSARTATVTISDRRGGTDTASVTIAVTPSSFPALSCAVDLLNIWGSGYQLGVRITNIGSTSASNACVTLEFPESTHLITYWGGTASSISSTLMRTCLNGTLNPGQTATVSVQGTHDGSFTVPRCLVAAP